MHHGNEIWHAYLPVQRAHAHREFVAKVAHRGKTHSWNPQMFAQGGRSLHIELVKRNNAVNLLTPRQVSDGLHDIGNRNFFWQVKGVIEALSRPVRIT